MENKKSVKKKISSFLIVNLIVSVIAFAFMISFVAESVQAMSKEEAWKDFLNWIKKIDIGNTPMPAQSGQVKYNPVTDLKAGSNTPNPAAGSGLFSPTTGTVEIEGIKKEIIYKATAKDGTKYAATKGGEYLKSTEKGWESVGNKMPTGLSFGDPAAGGADIPIIGRYDLGATWLNGIVGSLVWAGIAFGATYMIANMVGLDKDQSLAASAGVGTAVLIWKGAYEFQLFGSGVGKGLMGISLGPGLVGLALGVAVFAALYKEESKKIISFEAHPYEPPTGGKNCEKCNSDIYPCTEYRCKSLGQACELLNKGTGNEKCVWQNRQDVSAPVIQTLNENLTKGYEFRPDNVINPPDNGVKIVKITGDQCVKAFTPLRFGIKTDEPSQCKVDYNRTDNYDDMAYYFGNTNLYKYNHSQELSLPGPRNINAEVPEIKNDGDYKLYVKCQDANKNENENLFVISFCVEKGPDVTPPQIKDTSIQNNMPVRAGLNQTEIEFYVNEPAECKWSRLDQDYDNMDNEMECSTHVWEMNNKMLYKCTTTLTGIKSLQDNNYYIRCKDQPMLGESNDRNENQESYKFTLLGSQPIIITDIEPEPGSTIYGSGNRVTINLTAETQYGCCDNKATCYYYAEDETTKVQFYDTGGYIHKQRLDLVEGEYTYYVQCVDLGGNSNTTKTTFNIDIDDDQPVISRVYHEENQIKVVTDEKSECSYSNLDCNFDIEKGLAMTTYDYEEHTIPWDTSNMIYIRCKDKYNNQPNPNTCSVILNPYYGSL